MRKNVAFMAGLLLVTGLAGMNHVCAAAERTPWLGVYMQELTPELREGMDYRGSGGVILGRVVADGPAARAGLRKGDVVVRVNSRTVDSPGKLRDLIRAARVGQSLSVEVFRDGERRIVSVWLDERPGDAGHKMERPEAPEAPRPPDALAAPEASEAPEAPEPPGCETRPSPDGRRHVERIIGRAGKGPEGLRELEGIKEFDLPRGDTGFPGAAPRGRLGVRIESLNPGLGDYFGLKDGKGVLVLEVLDGSPAKRAGLEAGDVITRAGEEPVANGTDLVSALRGKEGKVALRVMRHGAPRTLEAVLEKPEPTRIQVFGDELGDRPGVRKQIIPRKPDRGDLRHELDQLRQQMEELRQRLDEGQGDDGEK